MIRKLLQNQWVKDEIGSLLSNPANFFQNFFFYLSLLVLPTQFGKHFWPSFSFVVGQRIDYLSPTLYISDLCIGGLFLTFVWQQKIRFSRSFFLVLLYLLLTVILSGKLLLGAYALLKILEFSFFAYAVSQLLAGREKISGWMVSAGIIVESLLGLTQYFMQHSLGGLWYFLGERTFSGSTPGIANASIFGELVLRPYGTFPHPNVLAGYLLVGMLLLLFFWQKPSSLSQKLWLWVTLVMGTLGLLFTFSRTAILLGVFSLSISLFFIKKISHRFPVLLFVIFLGAGVTLFSLFPFLAGRFLFQEDQSVLYRLTLDSVALQMIAQHPFFGIGLHNFIPTLPSYSSIPFLQPVHNIYLLIASEIGLIGLGGVVVLCVMFFKKVFGVTRRHVQRYFPLWLILFCVLGIGMDDHYLLTLQQGQLLLSLFIGTLLSVSQRSS